MQSKATHCKCKAEQCRAMQRDAKECKAMQIRIKAMQSNAKQSNAKQSNANQSKAKQRIAKQRKAKQSVTCDTSSPSQVTVSPQGTFLQQRKNLIGVAPGSLFSFMGDKLFL